MPKLTTHWLKTNNQYTHIRQWQTASYPKGVFHILHGMMEHSGMYQLWANDLCQLGWDVVCHDHPGSGYTVVENCSIDHLPKNGNQILSETIRVVNEWIYERYPNCPVVRYGHSMGAFLALNIERKKNNAKALILTGTTYEHWLILKIQAVLVKWLGWFIGFKKASNLAHFIAIKTLNKKFKNPTSPHEWISRRSEVLEQYTNDPLCGNVASWGYYDVLTRMLIEMVKETDGKLPPILILTGEKDALSNGGQKLTPLLNALQQQTMAIEHVIIPGAHHKIEADQNSEEILSKIDVFINKL